MNHRRRSPISLAARLLVLFALMAALAGCESPQNASTGDPDIPITETVHADRPFELRLIDATRDYVLHAMRAHGTPGLNLAMGYRGELIWEAGFGWADVAARKPMTPETVYHSGSLGKTYTATAIMHLVDRGVIALDDPISEHLPFEVHNPLGDRDVTVHDLLTHRSGLSGGGAKGVWDKPVPLEEALRASYASDTSPLLGATTPFWIAKVGTQFNYSNPGIATLGLIVQTANPDGLSFSDYVQRHIMDPLGMESSQYPPAQHEDYVRPDIWENMSTGYARMGSAWVPSVPLYFSHYPAGGVVAKPADHIRLLTAMMNGGEYDGYQVLEAGTVERDADAAVRGRDRPRDPGRPGVAPAESRGAEQVVRARRGPHVRLADGGVRMAGAGGDADGGAQPVESAGRVAGGWDDYRLRGGLADGRDAGCGLGAGDGRVGVEGVLRSGCDLRRDVQDVSSVSRARSRTEGLEEAIASTRVRPGGREDWDADGFRAGVNDIREAGFGYEQVNGFWSSEASRVPVEEAEVILRELGARFPGSSAIMFPPARGEGGGGG